MKWDQYKLLFSQKAKKHNLSDEKIGKCLVYAKVLYAKKLPIIYDNEHLSLLVGYQKDFLLRATNKPKKFYRSFSIPKKSGGKRKIHEPLPSLKEIQRWILKKILSRLKISPYAKAYRITHSIKDNARFHKNQKIVLTVDMNDFFGSLKDKKVFYFFRSLNYSPSVSKTLTNLCCLNGSLPQGAPTSPTLSNLLFYRCDCRIAGYVKSKNVRYTRYADDLTFSGNFEPGAVIKFVENVIKDENLKLNKKKTKAMFLSNRQEVTGIVVNEKLQVSREIRRKIRQEIHYIRKFGLSSHLEKTENVKRNHIRHLLGITNYVIFVNPKDQEVMGYRDYLKKYLTESNKREISNGD